MNTKEAHRQWALGKISWNKYKRILRESDEDSLCVDCNDEYVNKEDGEEMCSSCLMGNAVDMY